jgi:hypothetical protein
MRNIVKEDVEFRQGWAEKVGLGFTRGSSNVIRMEGTEAA